MWNIVESYFGNTFYFIILLCLLVIISMKKDIFCRKKLLIAIGVYCVCFPVLFVITSKFGLGNVFYRILWLFPVSIIVGIVSVWILKEKENSRGYYIIWSVILLLMLGNICFDTTHWKLPNNIYKVDKEVIEVAELIINDAEEETIVVVGEETFMMQVRQYSPRFRWGYVNRESMIYADRGNGSNESDRLAGAIQSNFFSPNNNIMDDLEKLKIDYLVLYQKNAFIEQMPSDTYEVIGTTYNYLVLKLNIN